MAVRRDSKGRFIKASDVDSGWQDFTKSVQRLRRAPAASVGVGWWGQARAVKAASNELGTRTIPERPFLRPSFDSSLSALEAMIRRDVGRLVDGAPLDAEQALLPAATLLRSQIIDTIITLSSPPNAPSTIAAKGSSNPLVDTGEMQRTIEIRSGEGE